MDLSTLTTEQRNKHSMQLDQMTTAQILQVINREDQSVAQAVGKVLNKIETAVELVIEGLKAGKKLIYVGAGTSGRLGILDAAECPPTFSISPDQVQALIAGGQEAMVKAVEGAEDDVRQGAEDVEECPVNPGDVVIGLSASGRTPYVLGALNAAKLRGAQTVAISCNRDAELSRIAHHAIEVVVGPEVLAGSTRMKAATAQKMILNMISTTAMIKLGKVYENLMVDLKVSNVKLRERARRILMATTGITYEETVAILEATGGEVKPAIVMVETGATLDEAKRALQASGGFVRRAIQLVQEEGSECYDSKN